jgi:(acyl-carrier-protein) S-malonyltransferase
MPKKIALLFAGQGAQCVGMGRDLAERYPVAADLFREADEILGRNLCDIAWNGPMEELTKTSNCQPALYVHALAALAALREVFGEFEVGGAAGLSLGEITAHARRAPSILRPVSSLCKSAANSWTKRAQQRKAGWRYDWWLGKRCAPARRG